MTDSPVNPHDASASTSIGLLERVKAHDAAAWTRVVGLYGPLIDGWCRLAGLQAADVDDLRQDVLLAVARSIANFRRDRPGDTFRGWLRTITGNKIRDHWRRTTGATAAGGSDAQQRMLEIPADDSDSETGEMSSVYRRALELIRGEFEDRTWQAFWRVVIESRTPADVAAELSITVNAVYLAKGRILARFRDEFEGLIEI